MPDIDCLLQLSSWNSVGGQEYLSFHTNLALFLTQPTNQETVFPSHRCEVIYEIPDFKSIPLKGGINFYGVGASNINATETFMSVRGSGLFEVRTKDSFKMDEGKKIVQDDSLFTDGVNVSLKLYSAESERSIELDIELKNQTAKDENLRQWNIGWHSFLEFPAR